MHVRFISTPPFIPSVSDVVCFGFRSVIDGEAAGRMVVNLRADICPVACENFRLLCTGEKGPSYKGSVYHLPVARTFIFSTAP